MAVHKCNKEVEIAEINLKITQMKEKIDDMHARMIGKDNKSGLIDEWNQMKGSVSTWKWIAGSGLVLTIVKFFI